MTDVSYPLAFIGGVMSFLSPCVLPLIPVYISIISGLSYEELTQKRFSFRTIINTLAFVGGFSTIFISLGASSSIIGGLFIDYQNILRIAGGLMVILFGLLLSGIFNPNILMRDLRVKFNSASTGIVGAFLMGVVFAAGWTPCIGPILGTILVYTASQGSAQHGFMLLSVYSLGLAIPFLMAALLINLFFTYTRKIHRFMRAFSVIIGVVLIIFGLLLITDKLSLLLSIFPDLGVKF